MQKRSNVVLNSIKIFLLFILSLFTIQAFAASSLQVTKFESAKKIPVYFYATHDLPIIDIRVLIDAGSIRDGERYGLAALTADVMEQGTKNLDATMIAQRFGDVGALYWSSITPDAAIFNLRTLKEAHAAQQALATFTAILHEPAFAQDVLTREKNKTLVAIDAQEELPDAVASLAFRQMIYAGTPYAHDESGEKNTVTKITQVQIRNFYRQYYTANNSKIVIVGDLSLEEAKNIAEIIAKALPVGQMAAPIPVNFAKTMSSRDIKFPTTQANLWLGQRGIPRLDPDYFSLYVGNQILGGRGTMTSRLFQAVRVQQGLVYSVSSELQSMRDAGAFVIVLQTREEEKNKALALVEQLFTDFVREGPTVEELNKIKQYLQQSYPLRFISNDALADQIALLALYNLPLDYFVNYPTNIANVSQEEIKMAFAKHFAGKALLKVVVSQHEQKNTAPHS